MRDQRQLLLPVYLLLNASAHSRAVAGSNSRMTGRWTTRPMAASVGVGAGADVLPPGEGRAGRDAQGPALVSLCGEGGAIASAPAWMNPNPDRESTNTVRTAPDRSGRPDRDQVLSCEEHPGGRIDNDADG